MKLLVYVQGRARYWGEAAQSPLEHVEKGQDCCQILQGCDQPGLVFVDRLATKIVRNVVIITEQAFSFTHGLHRA